MTACTPGSGRSWDHWARASPSPTPSCERASSRRRSGASAPVPAARSFRLSPTVEPARSPAEARDRVPRATLRRPRPSPRPRCPPQRDRAADEHGQPDRHCGHWAQHRPHHSGDHGREEPQLDRVVRGQVDVRSRERERQPVAHERRQRKSRSGAESSGTGRVTTARAGRVDQRHRGEDARARSGAGHHANQLASVAGASRRRSARSVRPWGPGRRPERRTAAACRSRRARSALQRSATIARAPLPTALDLHHEVYAAATWSVIASNGRTPTEQRTAKRREPAATRRAASSRGWSSAPS